VLVVSRSREDRNFLRSLVPEGTSVLEEEDPCGTGERIRAELPHLVLLAVNDALPALQAARPGPPLPSGTEAPLVFAEGRTPEGIESLVEAGADEILLSGEPVEWTRKRLRRVAETRRMSYEADLLRTAVSVASTGTFIADATRPGFPFIYSTGAFERFTGLNPGQLLGPGAVFLVGPQTASEEAARIRRAMRQGESCFATIQVLGAGGATFWCDLALTPIGGTEGSPVRWAGSLTDVTDRMLTEELERKRQGLEELVASRTSDLGQALQKLDARRQFIETVLDALTAGIIATDSDGVITMANRAALALLELQEATCIGSSVHSVFDSEGRLEIAMREANDEIERRLEFTYRTPSGRRLEIGLAVIQVGSARRSLHTSGVFRLPDLVANSPRAPQTLRYVFVFRDLGVQRQFELEMRRVEGLSALGQMAAGIAHEIRNPLAAIRSLIETLQLDVPEGDERREYVTRILSLTSRIERIVRSSLRFARPKPPAPRLCSPVDLVEEALEILGPRIGGKGMPAVVAFDALPHVQADSDQVVEVFVALLENALDVVEDPGRVEIHLRLAAPDDAGHGGKFVKFEFIDDGPGVPREIAARIFDPFFTTKAKGTGLGLSIAQRLLRDNHGELRLQPQQGPGTKFCVFLPVAAP
jgi:PAS domain S-box-containing protein